MMKQFLKRATGFDYAVYWPPAQVTPGVGATDNYGKYITGDPVEIKCRWEDIQTDFVDREGVVRVCTHKVFTVATLEFGGVLWHGRLVDANQEPLSNLGALTILQLTTLPSFKNDAKLTIAIL